MTNEARIETSTVCNYNCTFCPHDRLTRKKEFMSMELFTEILTKLPKEITILTLSGLGEMFLDPTIFQKIALAKSQGYHVNALTNGSMMNSVGVNALKSSGIDSIRISIHASDLNTYQEITGASVGGYKNVNFLINNIPKNIHSIITVDMTKDNTEEVSKMIELYNDKVDLLEIWKVHNWAGEFDYREGEKVKTTCGRPFHGPLQIQVDGTVNMCCFDYDGELTLGDLRTQSLDDIFKGPMYEAIVDFHTGKSSYDNLLCTKCDQLYEKDESILLYNSGFSKDRIGTLSTTYQEMMK